MNTFIVGKTIQRLALEIGCSPDEIVDSLVGMQIKSDEAELIKRAFNGLPFWKNSLSQLIVDNTKT